MKIMNILIDDESIELKPYKDVFGNWTIGVGRNLDDTGISYNEAMLMLQNDIERCRREAEAFWWYVNLDDCRRDVVIMMIFNMGIARFRTFTHMIAALEHGDYRTASIEMLQSRWEQQVGDRAHKLATMMASGKYPETKH
jgi:lysozyme